MRRLNRIRQSAAATVSPNLRVVLEGAAVDGASAEESRQIEEALAALEAESAKGRSRTPD